MEMSGISGRLGVAFYVMGIAFWSAMAAMIDARVTRSDYSQSANIQFAITFGIVWPLSILVVIFVFWIKWWGNIGIQWGDKVAEMKAEMERGRKEK